MLKVGVLLGGKSIEREVSFNSGRTVCDHLDTAQYQAIPIFQTAAGDLYLLPWSFLYRGKIADFEHRLEREAKKIVWDDLPILIDFMYIATHGRYAEDGRLQAILELFKIPYLGAKVFGSALGLNKVLSNIFLKLHNFVTPRGFGLSVEQIENYDQSAVLNLLQQHNLQFPVVIKPQSEGSSFGVFVARDAQELLALLKKSCFICANHGQDVLIEEKIEGMEFCCIVITDDATGSLVALPPTEIVLQKHESIFSYQHKYMPGRAHKRTPAHCSPESIKKIQDVCVRAMQALQFETFARFDGFLTATGEVILIDCNSLSGMAPSSFLFQQAAEVGIGHAQLINQLIKTELKNYRKE